MVVVVTNITDEPRQSGRREPVGVDVYNKTLAPGATMNLPAELVDKKVRKLEEQGLIAIGQVPPWYERAKIKGAPRILSQEEIQNRILKKSTPPVLTPAKALPLMLVEEAVPVSDELKIEVRPSKRKG